MARARLWHHLDDGELAVIVSHDEVRYKCTFITDTMQNFYTCIPCRSTTCELRDISPKTPINLGFSQNRDYRVYKDIVNARRCKIEKMSPPDKTLQTKQTKVTLL